ncbi:MAG: hypothetical protein DIJKHBIC_03592 [Thermoanaerobaculia bacterium]|nr:hypothetical protein [Thermoanaerobaculia bacterium]
MAEIVDGNNLLMSLGGGSRDVLLSELSELARRKRKPIVVVFDGPPPSGRGKVQHLGAVTIVHAAPRTADEEIVRRIQESRDPKGITVVTDDRGLASAARSAGARVASVSDFKQISTRRLSAGRETEREPGLPVSAREWEKWFSDERNRIK